MPDFYGSVPAPSRPVHATSRRSAIAKAATVLLAMTLASVLAVVALLAPSFFTRGNSAGRTALMSAGVLPPMVDSAQSSSLAPASGLVRSEAGFVMPPFSGELRGGRGRRDRFGMSLPPGGSSRAVRQGQQHLRSSLSAVVPPGPAVPPHVVPGIAPWVAPQHWFKKVPPTKDYEHVRFHKVPTGEVAYYGDKRYGPWFAEHKHEDSEINTYPSDCTSGCDLKQSRMLEAAEGMVKVALDTHESREAAYKEQRTRNVKWAKHINKMLEKIAPREADGVCHRTVDCEDCQGLTDEDKCKQKLGIWVPKVSVMKEANKEATKDKTELNKQLEAAVKMIKH